MSRGEDCAEEPEPTPVEAPKRKRKPKLKEKYNVGRMTGSFVLPKEVQSQQTYLPTFIVACACLFNGVPNAQAVKKWRGILTRLEVRGVLFPYDMETLLALFQEAQRTGCMTADGALAAVTSALRLYRYSCQGKYGGSNLQTVLASLRRLREAIIVIHQEGKAPVEVRPLESIEAISGPSGSRLLIRVSRFLTDKLQDKRNCKPVVFTELRGRSLLAYLMVDYQLNQPTHRDPNDRTKQELRSNAELRYDTLIEQLNLRGSAARKHQQLDRLTVLHGQPLSKAGFLQMEAREHKFTFRRSPTRPLPMTAARAA